MVVVGLGVGWSCSGLPELERLRQENKELKDAIRTAAAEWANEKGKPVSIDVGSYIVDAQPDGDITLASKAIPVPAPK